MYFALSHTVSSFSSPHYIFSVSCGIREQWSIAAWFVVLLLLEGFSLTGGHHFVHLSVQKGPFGGLEGLDVSVRAVAGLGQRGAPLLTGSVDKLIDFISVSHTTPNPYWPDIHMFTVQRITLPPSSVSLFFLPQFLSPTTFFFCLYFFYISFTLYLSPSLRSPLKGNILNLARPCLSRRWRSPLREAGGAVVGTLVFSAIPLDEALEQGNESFGKGLETSHSSV